MRSNAVEGRPPLLVTLGEPAGIGPDVVLSAWLSGRMPEPDRGPVAAFVVIGDADALSARSRRLGLEVPISVVGTPEEGRSAFRQALPVLHRPLSAPPVAGRPDPANAPAVLAAIEEAVSMVRSGRGAAVVTGPIHKKTLYDGGFTFPGHTEYLAALAGPGAKPVMMLASPQLRVVPVTVHLPLRGAVEALSTDGIVTAARTTAAALAGDFGIAAPRLAVAGLNPHAGEDGALGREELDIIAPALAHLHRQGITVAGPVPPDALFTPSMRDSYDAAICMYHDQALIPLKALDFDGGVNVTLGLPFVRTSPDHGTALDIAGSGIARPDSLIAALRLAAEISARRSTAGMA
ncbi:MAG: 4-hydroxythreonine-4-phosphate dehydrogenase PdxA [Rhodospirillales bacterium]|nr:MAG: 4-hydroxythreonine-4-phosphate dehydrogenase PdxA [Rhodospirillales bacterium]